MKKIVSILMVSLMISCLFACGKKASNEQASNNAAVNTAVTNSASANVPAEYKQVTTNENGVKIYGKIVDENTASEVGKKVIEGNKIGDKNASKDGIYYTYSEYYSETYGDTIILKTGNTKGSRVYYNEKGQKFAAGSEASANVDVETILKNYRIGNAMADAMDKKIKGK